MKKKIFQKFLETVNSAFSMNLYEFQFVWTFFFSLFDYLIGFFSRRGQSMTLNKPKNMLKNGKKWPRMDISNPY